MSLRRIQDDAAVDHEWIGNDDNGNHHHGIVNLTGTPFHIQLHWKTKGEGPLYFIGKYEIDLLHIVKDGYARWEKEDVHQIRLRIEHTEDGLIRVAKTQGGKGLTIGWLKT